ncbi:AbgT family transporter [Thermaurantimonas aggregans]|nr:AbgT family transporter [Thermaurantimonas aggregans]MCX8147781.1 AbgT family transporter [Thermaurantimonas aggregans]
MTKSSRVDRFLALIERAGNALPHPATLFFLFAVFVVVLSAVVSFFHIEVVHPGNGSIIKPVNLISREGLDMILTKMVTNFTGFAPLGTVLVALLGIGIAEGSGLIGVVLRKIVLSSPPKLLTFVVVFAGVLSNTASEVGYVLLVPLAAIIFQAAGRHPLAGLAAAFAGVSGGYSANLLLGTIDPLLAGLSEEAARIIDKDYLVNPACNYYFMAFSTILISFLGTFVTEKIVEPRLGKDYLVQNQDKIEQLNSSERRGLIYALVTFLAFTALILIGIIPENGVLRGADGSVLKSPFMHGIVALVFLSAGLMGIAYGIGAGTIKNDSDVMKGMSKSMETLGSYIVLVFFAAQFVAYFNWTNLGLISAVKGAEGLKAIIGSLGLENKLLMAVFIMIPFILLSALINLVMGSASAKWAIMAPVFIPMLMLLGYSPEFTQVAYRIGDSVTNIISPMMSYFALIVAFIQRYQPKAGIGTVISLMLPYSVLFLIGWVLLLIVWIAIDLPIGPGVSLYYTP